MRFLIITILLTVSVFFSFAQDVKKTISHTVEAGQTLFFISKKYNLSIDELRKQNPVIEEDLIIRPDQVLSITVLEKKEVPTENFLTHKVESKETLYSLSKKYNVSVDDLIFLNDLEEPSISIGQMLKIKKLKVDNQALFNAKTVVDNTKTVENELDTVANEIPKDEVLDTIQKTTDSDLYKLLFDGYASETNKLRKSKGIGNFVETTAVGYYALVNDIPDNSVIKVRNLMNNKVVYLKVVGNVPANDQENNVYLKISKEAAKELTILEDRFLAEWTWYENLEKNDSLDKTNEKVLFNDF